MRMKFHATISQKNVTRTYNWLLFGGSKFPDMCFQKNLGKRKCMFTNINKINLTKNQDKLLRAWATIVRDSNLNIPFIMWTDSLGSAQDTFSVRLARFLKHVSFSVSSGHYCTSIIDGSKVTITHLLPHLLTIPLYGQWDVQRSERGYWLLAWLWIWTSILSCGAIPQDL